MIDVCLLTKWLVAPIVSGICFLAFPVTRVSSENVPGGYSTIGLSDDAKAAAEYAVQEQAKLEAAVLKLTDISRAERQIVAGVNYRLDIVVTVNGSERKARIVVFKDLKSHYQVASWEWLT